MGGGKIKDATALPEDVASGKVFYNNDGRQVGTGLSVKSISIPKFTGVTLVNKDFVDYRVIGQDVFYYGMTSGNVTYSTNETILQGAKGIVGFKQNGVYYDCFINIKIKTDSSDNHRIHRVYRTDNGKVVFTVNHYNAGVHTDRETGELEIFYI